MTHYGGIRCCLNCQDRHVGCHGSCDRYKAENEAHLDYLAKVRAERRAQTAGYSERLLTHTHRKGKEVKKGQP